MAGQDAGCALSSAETRKAISDRDIADSQA